MPHCRNYTEYLSANSVRSYLYYRNQTTTPKICMIDFVAHMLQLLWVEYLVIAGKHVCVVAMWEGG